MGWIEFINPISSATVTLNTDQITLVNMTATGNAEVWVVGQDRPVSVPTPYLQVTEAIKNAAA